MANLMFKTKGNGNPQGKPRVYFTCHPGDFDRAFDKICEDIFKTHDCAIYYTEDMNEEIPEEDKTTDLERMNLFVIPVTFRLLSTPNRAMDSDFRFAIEKHVPVLPIMLETGIDEFYSRKDKFGELQYLNPYSHDITEISYEEKLKKYLESVLISDEMADKVRAAFDVYIFLSYRKKDRRYVNELMRIIHSNPICRDVAIWYDEFLTPGENFNDAIGKALEKSELFTLLVTPNLINEENYVRTTEYPAAKKAGKEILPAEMETTDSAELQKQFENIPECVNVYDEEAFRSRLLESVKRLAIKENDSSPEHNFLIGLAYLDGIDVEVDRSRALELITSAAEAELPEAMEKLLNMYHEGVGVELNYQEALKWSKRIADYYTREYGEKNSESLTALHNLAFIYRELGNYRKAIEIFVEVYDIRCELLGDNHLNTLTTLINLSGAYNDLGDYKRAVEYGEKAYKLLCANYGKEEPKTISAYNDIALGYYGLGEYRKALEILEHLYNIECRAFGEEHPDTLVTLNNLAVTYEKLGNHKKALELNEKAYALLCNVLGEKHPDTLMALSNLALTYADLGILEKALELSEKAYKCKCMIIGKKHPNSNVSLNNTAIIYGKMNNHKKALELFKEAYIIQCKVEGENHPNTLVVLDNLADTYLNLNDYNKSLELSKKAYLLRRELLGEEHPDTLSSLHLLAYNYGVLGDCDEAGRLFEIEYNLRSRVLGKEHPDTLEAKNFLAFTYSTIARAYNDLGDTKKAIEICDYILELDTDLIETIETIASIYEQNGFSKKAATIKARLA